MNRNQIIVLSLAVFLLGDAEATWRASWQKRIEGRKFKHLMDVQQLKINALVTFANDIADDMDREEAFAKLNSEKNFIDIVE